MMHMYGGGQKIDLTRDVNAIQIPEGTKLLLKQSDPVYVMQVLGGMFTVETEQGFLARIDGRDADALGQEVPPERKPIDMTQSKSVEEHVWEQLRTCYDPEIPVNIVELGLIYNVKVIDFDAGGYRVDIEMTLTAPGCGMGEILKQDIEQKVLDIADVKVANVEIVFDPAWESSMMTEAARLQLGMM
jgi:probable FeS assembly SUF system protein SufT